MVSALNGEAVSFRKGIVTGTGTRIAILQRQYHLAEALLLYGGIVIPRLTRDPGR